MQTTEQNVLHKKDLQRIKELRLMDDDFFSEALDGKIEAVEYILNTILERGYKSKINKGTGGI